MKVKGFIMAVSIAITTILMSCSPKTTDDVVALKRGNITGNWVLDQISYEGIPASAVQSLFNDAQASCFEGSTWHLTNSGNGTYTLLGGANCAAKTQTIFWSVSTADETFQFKKIEAGQKARDVSSGYRLILAAATGTSLTLKSPVEITGGAAYVVLNFTKAAK